MSIQGFGEILFDRLEGEMKEFAGIVRKESERLLRFLNTFLDITRIEENRQPVNLTSVILSDVVKEVAFELKPIAESVGITINSEIPAEIGPAVVDRDLTKQCLINLLENAIKYSSPGKEVIIRLTEEPEHLKAEIIDQGIGIREEDVVRVFDKFYRAQPDGLGNREGSGLGLTFVKEAIELQGGKVLVESRYGGGSTFTLMIPKGDAKNNQPLGA
jgi:signal transduction histidine kinase